MAKNAQSKPGKAVEKPVGKQPRNVKGPARRKGNATFPPDKDKDEYAYAAAELLCDGVAANEIAKKLFSEWFDKKDSEPARMWTKRLIRQASRQYLRLEPKVTRYKRHEKGEVRMTLSCVNDLGVRHWQSAVCRQAARELAQWILDALSDPTRKDQEKIRIANAGGPTIQKMVQYLESEALVPSEKAAERLEFASLNAAGKYANYHISGNYLAIYMAGIYSGASHRVVLPETPKADDYDLAICGVGTTESFFVDLLREHEIDTSKFIGDIAFNPIDKRGNRVILEGDQTQLDKIRQKLLAQIDYDQCLSLAQRGRLWLLVPRRSDHKDDAHEVLKEKVLAAVLQRGLASHCIIGQTLWEARALDKGRDDWIKVQPQKDGRTFR